MQKSQLIEIISRASDHYGDRLVAFMEEVGIRGLREATREQLESFIERHGLKERADNETI